MASIGASNAAAEASAQGGSEEFNEYYTKEKNNLISELRGLLVELNSLYTQTIDKDHIEDLQQLKADEMRKRIEAADIADDVMQAIRHPSSKGGGDVIDDDELAQKQADFQRRKNEAYRALYGARNDIYKLNTAKKENEEFKRIALKGMQTVYKLRQIFLGEVEERIAVTFAENGYLKVITIPMSQFLSNAQNLISITEESFSKQMYGDPYKIALRNSKTVIDQLKQIQGASVNNVIANGKQITKDIYEELKKNRNFILRYGKGYKIVAKEGKGQGGFIAEALVRATLTDNPYEYKQDRETWYQKPDITNNLGIGYSVKNTLDSAPTLLRINSLQTALSQLIQILSSNNLTPAQMVNQIKSTVFGQITDLDASVEEHVLKIVQEGLGI